MYSLMYSHSVGRSCPALSEEEQTENPALLVKFRMYITHSTSTTIRLRIKCYGEFYLAASLHNQRRESKIASGARYLYEGRAVPVVYNQVNGQTILQPSANFLLLLREA